MPCRWQKSGWKYVEVEPAATKFFKNANRVNSVGFSRSPQLKVDQNLYTPEAKQFYKEDPYAQTTY